MKQLPQLFLILLIMVLSTPICFAQSQEQAYQHYINTLPYYRDEMELQKGIESSLSDGNFNQQKTDAELNELMQNEAVPKEDKIIFIWNEAQKHVDNLEKFSYLIKQLATLHPDDKILLFINYYSALTNDEEKLSIIDLISRIGKEEIQRQSKTKTTTHIQNFFVHELKNGANDKIHKKITSLYFSIFPKAADTHSSNTRKKNNPVNRSINSSMIINQSELGRFFENGKSAELRSLLSQASNMKKGDLYDFNEQLFFLISSSDISKISQINRKILLSYVLSQRQVVQSAWDVNAPSAVNYYYHWILANCKLTSFKNPNRTQRMVLDHILHIDAKDIKYTLLNFIPISNLNQLNVDQKNALITDMTYELKQHKLYSTVWVNIYALKLKILHMEKQQNHSVVKLSI